LIWQEPRLVFPGAHKPRPIPLPELPKEARKVTLETTDGLALIAHELPPATEAAHTRWAIFFPGQWGRQDWDMPKVTLLRELGCAVLLVDYRGYAGNPGQPSESGLYCDADAAWAHLMTKGIPSSRILIYGHSLGSGVALDLASRVQPGAVIVDGAYDSVTSCGAARYPLLPIALVSQHRFESVGKVARITAPKLFLHGAYDEMIPVGHGRAAFAAATEPKTWVELRGRHEDFQWMDPARWRAAMIAFIESL
jgi:fermentation-respiration switch protein FrsA (DUF1100 family)